MPCHRTAISHRNSFHTTNRGRSEGSRDDEAKGYDYYTRNTASSACLCAAFPDEDTPDGILKVATLKNEKFQTCNLKKYINFTKLQWELFVNRNKRALDDAYDSDDNGGYSSASSSGSYDSS